MTQINNHDPLTEKIIACCFKVHNELGPGFTEKIYQRALILALKEKSLAYVMEREFEVFFQEKKVGALRLDLIIDDKVIVEVKALVGNLPEVFKYQILSYLRISRIQVGLLVNFGSATKVVR